MGRADFFGDLGEAALTSDSGNVVMNH